MRYELGEVGVGHWNRFASVNNEFAPEHMDDAAARAAGFDAAYAMGTLQWAYVHRALGQWFNDPGCIAAVTLRFVAPAYRGHYEVVGTAFAIDRLAVEVHVDGVTTAAGTVRLR